MKMLQKLTSAVVVVLAVNFIGMAIAAALLAQKTGVDREKLVAIREILFPREEDDTAEEAVDAAEPPEPTPMEQLLTLLDAQAGKPTEARVDDLQQTFDQRTAQLTRARRELADLQRQLDIASSRLVEERETFEATREEWEQAATEAEERARDAGFADALALYQQLPAKLTKDIFLQLEEEIVLEFLRAMDGQTAARIIREFKSDAETQKARSILERMRQGEPIANSAGRQAT